MLLLTAYYLYLFRVHEVLAFCRSSHSLQSSILPLHKAIFLVMVVALAEATVWFAAYQKINLTGTPYCCPFPPLVVGALIMQVILSAGLSHPMPRFLDRLFPDAFYSWLV